MLRGILFLSNTCYTFDESEKVIHLVSTANLEQVIHFVSTVTSRYSDEIVIEITTKNKNVTCKIRCSLETNYEAICLEIERQIR